MCTLSNSSSTKFAATQTAMRFGLTFDRFDSSRVAWQLIGIPRRNLPVTFQC
jgi:hypothetical protein